MQQPASAGSVTTPATETATLAPGPAGATVPDAFVATWSGTGTQVNPAVEWPVTITITGGGVGDVVGTSDYPGQACGGELILRGATADAIVLTEQLTYGLDSCTDGGTITLSGLDVIAVSFDWSGTRADGSASSATGTLDRPDSATGPAGGGTVAQPGTQDGPVIDTTQLHSYYIGTFSGTGNQENPASAWPITVTFTGGRPGEVVGTVEYPTLGCGGELVLVSINPNDEWLGFEATERITYGQETCIDGGTFVFSSESAVGITFGWTSPDSATTASGSLPRVEPGASSAPVDQASEPDPAPDVSAPEEPAGGAPPSIYDDPNAEPVPIEADGG
jgi:hypothetical protein